jgi:hypothetical protein
MKSEANPSPCNKLSHLALQSRLLGRYSRQLRKSCASANKAYSRAERVFIFEHYFEFKSFAVVYEARCSAYSVKEVPNEAMVQFSVEVRYDNCLNHKEVYEWREDSKDGERGLQLVQRGQQFCYVAVKEQMYEHTRHN